MPRTLNQFEFIREPLEGRATVEIGAFIRARDELFERLATALGFPAYFGANWDALIDCLSDLGWSDAEELVIDHASLPTLPPAELRAYLDSLLDAAQRRTSDERPRLRIVFRERDRDAVEGAMSG